MRRKLLSVLVLALIPCASATVQAFPGDAERMIKRARAAIERGDVDVVRDLAPLVAALPKARGGGCQALISAIEELGRHDGASPAAVKDYLREQAPPALLAVARGKGDWSVRSDALMALRTLNAADEYLDQAAVLAEADNSPQAGFFHSRGALLRDWKRSRPAPLAGAQALRPADPGREQRALAYLKRRGLGVSAYQLQSSAMEGNAEEVEALLDAGLRVDTPGVVGSALTSATGLGCATDPGNLDGRLKVVRVLLARGADVNARDSLDNTVLLTAAQHCPLPVVRALVEAGAGVNTVNRQGVGPLSMAFLGNNWEVAEYLVERGARMKASAIDAVFFELPPDPAKRALIQRATVK